MHSREEKKLRLLWLRFLREINEKTTTVDAELLEVPEIFEAINLAEQSAYSVEELNFYEEYWDSVSRERSVIADSFGKGKAEGMAEGEAIGEFNTILKMHASGMSIQIIANIIGKTEQNIKNLINTNKK